MCVYLLHCSELQRRVIITPTAVAAAAGATPQGPRAGLTAPRGPERAAAAAAAREPRAVEAPPRTSSTPPPPPTRLQTAPRNNSSSSNNNPLRPQQDSLSLNNTQPPAQAQESRQSDASISVLRAKARQHALSLYHLDF